MCCCYDHVSQDTCSFASIRAQLLNSWQLCRRTVGANTEPAANSRPGSGFAKLQPGPCTLESGSCSAFCWLQPCGRDRASEHFLGQLQRFQVRVAQQSGIRAALCFCLPAWAWARSWSKTQILMVGASLQVCA